MDSAEQITSGGWNLCYFPDLTTTPLEELVARVNSGDDVVLDVVASAVGGQEDPSLVPVTAFNSSI